MFIARTEEDVNLYISTLKEADLSASKEVGFVPTMGYLHEGHMSLVRKAKQKGQIVVVSIFVNPTQFNNPEDLEKYPIDIPRDLLMLENEGVDLVFLPTKEVVYPDSYSIPTYAIGDLEHILEGEFRPGHFQGVCAVIARFQEIIKCNTMYLGQKDVQQCAVIGKLFQIQQFEVQPKLSVVPTVRNESGLALSSRNARILPEKLAGAQHLYQALKSCQNSLKEGEQFSVVEKKAISTLEEKGFRVEYLSLTKISDMSVQQDYYSEGDSVLSTAAWYEGVRLIDNIIL